MTSHKKNEMLAGVMEMVKYQYAKATALAVEKAAVAANEAEKKAESKR